jgi:hypothetical protein
MLTRDKVTCHFAEGRETTSRPFISHFNHDHHTTPTRTAIATETSTDNLRQQLQ